VAVDSNAITIADYALYSNDPLVREISMSMINAGSVFEDVPVITRKTLKAVGSRTIGGLPTVGWKKLNAEPTAVKTTPDPYSETFYFFRDAVQIDEYIQEDENQIDDPVDYNVQAYFTALSYELNDALINNTHVSYATRNRTVNLDCFVGLRERLDNAEYKMQSADTLKTADASAGDLSDSGITGAKANVIIRSMQSVMDAMGAEDGDGVVIYMNDDLIARLEYGIRAMGAGGGFDMTRDAFDRKVMTYRNAKIKRIGRSAPTVTGSQSYIITSTESADGMADTGSVYTSMYFVKWGKQTGYGWQFHPPKVTPEYELDSNVIKQVVMKGGYGLMFPNTRAIGRLKGIKVA
jgi:hypothetical protein